MIDYAELVHALHDWRVRQGLPVGSGLPVATPPPPAHAIKVAAPAPPPRPGAGRVTAPPPMPMGGAAAGAGRMPTAELLSDEDALVEDAIEPDAYDAGAMADAHGATQGYPAQGHVADDYNDATTAGASLDDQGGLVESVAFAPFGAEATAAASLDEMRPYDGGFDAPGHTRLGHKPASARALVDDDPLAGGDDDDKTRG